jgi:hypothetical protein
MRSFAVEVAAGDFAFAAGHRRLAISLLVGTLNSAAAFSIAACSSGASTSGSQTALLSLDLGDGATICGSARVSRTLQWAPSRTHLRGIVTLIKGPCDIF